MSIRDRALAKRAARSEIVTVPDWADADGNGGDVKLVALTAGERLTIIKRATVTSAENGEPQSSVDNALLYPMLIAASARDPETGEKLFADGDSEAIMANDAGLVESLAMRVLTISGMTKDAQRVIAKNSAPTPSAATATA